MNPPSGTRSPSFHSLIRSPFVVVPADLDVLLSRCGRCRRGRVMMFSLSGPNTSHIESRMNSMALPGPFELLPQIGQEAQCGCRAGSWRPCPACRRSAGCPGRSWSHSIVLHDAQCPVDAVQDVGRVVQDARAGRNQAVSIDGQIDDDRIGLGRAAADQSLQGLQKSLVAPAGSGSARCSCRRAADRRSKQRDLHRQVDVEAADQIVGEVVRRCFRVNR